MSTVTPQRSSPQSIWGTANYSPWVLSDALTRLDISHSILVVPAPGETRRLRVVNRKKPQPKWVHLSNIAEGVRVDSTNLISMSYSALQLTNFMKFPRGDLGEGLMAMLQSEERIRPKVQFLTPLDYVNLVAKPSLLNHISTEVYKINPYALRKETQAMILRFFNSQISLKVMIHFLQKSLKQASIIPMIESGLALREAVARLKTEPLEVVAKTSGFPTFELLYISKTRKE